MKKIIETEEAPIPLGPYSQAIKANNFLFISGQVSVDPATNKIVKGDIQVQTRRILENVKAVLEAAGLSIKHIVKVTVFLKKSKDFVKMNEVYTEWFGKNFPARSAVQANIPASEEFLVEMEAIAACP